jgi:SHAQKYF class myb-like DNA-binding protein
MVQAAWGHGAAQQNATPPQTASAPSPNAPGAAAGSAPPPPAAPVSDASLSASKGGAAAAQPAAVVPAAVNPAAAVGAVAVSANPTNSIAPSSEQSNISLSAQVELELELSLRGSLLVQQQRRIVQLEDELQRAWSEIDRLRTKIASFERERQRNEDDSHKQPRYWTPEEHRLFMEAVQRFGWKDVKSIAQHVGTRTPTQVRTHAQKLFLRQQKEQTGVMQPVKNGRGDTMGMPPDMGVGRGGERASSPSAAMGINDSIAALSDAAAAGEKNDIDA